MQLIDPGSNRVSQAGLNKFGFKTCPFCASNGDGFLKPNEETPRVMVFVFRDELSQQEYRISGLCQKCQDETFG